MWQGPARSACRPQQRNLAMVLRCRRPTAASSCRAIIAHDTTRTRSGSTPPCSRACSRVRSSSNVLGETPVKVGPAVTEEAEGRAMLFRFSKIHSRTENSRFVRAEFREHVAPFVANEAVPVETLAMLRANAGRGHYRNDV